MIKKAIFKLLKVARILGVPRWRRALWFHGVAAGVEHPAVLRLLGDMSSIIDIGANRGQFALAARRCYPTSKIVSFEPLDVPSKMYRAVFRDDPLTTLIQVAIGPSSGDATIHVSARDDSSSILPISNRQIQLFPGTEEIEVQQIKICRLAEHLRIEDIVSPALLKLDVQGFELAALNGCADRLHCFDWVYAECSFLELYEGQALVDEVIAFLRLHKFSLIGVYHMAFDTEGSAVQADFLFRRVSRDSDVVAAKLHCRPESRRGGAVGS